MSYESDCTTSFSPGEVAPFVSSTVINTTPGSAAPSGATFGVDGTVAQTLIGPFLAAFDAGYGSILGFPTTLGLSVNQTFGSTDGHATGTDSYTHTFAPVTNPGGAVSGVTFSSGSTTLTGDFSSAAVGDFVSDGTTSANIVNGTTITAINGTTSATISQATTGASSATGDYVAFVPAAGLTFIDSSFSSGDVFTTAGTPGQTAGIGITSTTSFGLTTSLLTIPFGGTAGVRAANCLLTGWVNATTPGPAQTGETAPALPFGIVTPLVSATPTFEPGAFLNLVSGN